MRSARVPGFDDEFAAVEGELLAVALKKDLRSLDPMASYFKQCARRDGGLPPERDGVRASMVGGRLAMDADVGGLTGETIYTALDAFTDAPSEGDNRTLAQRRLMVSPGCAGSRWAQTRKTRSWHHRARRS